MHVCMIVPNEAVKGGIASVVNGYRGSVLEEHYRITYIESYQNGSKWSKLAKVRVNNNSKLLHEFCCIQLDARAHRGSEGNAP